MQAQQAAVASIATKRDELIRELARQQNLSVKLVAQRQRALERIRRQQAAAAAQAAAEAAVAAAAAAQAAAAAASNTPPSGTPGTTPVPTTSGDAQVAINFAYAQLGEPYVWAAAGPDSWDCSGLTMGAWAAAGVYLPHYSVAQYAATMPISAGELRPATSSSGHGPQQPRHDLPRRALHRRRQHDRRPAHRVHGADREHLVLGDAELLRPTLNRTALARRSGQDDSASRAASKSRSRW